MVCSREIQMRSFSLLSISALSELLGALIKSSMKHTTWSIFPVWSGLFKCIATGCSLCDKFFFFKSSVCSLNLTAKTLLVRPTYCLPHVLQVMP